MEPQSSRTNTRDNIYIERTSIDIEIDYLDPYVVISNTRHLIERYKICIRYCLKRENTHLLYIENGDIDPYIVNMLETQVRD